MIKQRLSVVQEILKGSKVDLPFHLKVKMAELILNLISRRSNFGLFAILGWRNKWRGFINLPDVSQDIFVRHHINIMNVKPRIRRRYDVSATAKFDGALLIDRRGNLVHSGAVIESLRPGIVGQKLNPGDFKDLSEQFGFKQKVHLRHLTAITASYTLKDTTVFTVSEETGDFHIFENGRIIYSTVEREI